jgi:cell division protein ZapA (FtsZ GTPase activity inhibitor)
MLPRFLKEFAVTKKSTQSIDLVLDVAGRDYKLRTAPQHATGLTEAAEQLNDKIHAVRQRGRNLSNEQAAVLAALELSYDLLIEREMLAQQLELAKS